MLGQHGSIYNISRSDVVRMFVTAADMLDRALRKRTCALKVTTGVQGFRLACQTLNLALEGAQLEVPAHE